MFYLIKHFMYWNIIYFKIYFYNVIIYNINIHILYHILQDFKQIEFKSDKKNLDLYGVIQLGG